MKVMINTCYGGFSISEEAVYAYAKRKGLSIYPENHEFTMKTYWTIPEDKRDGYLRGAAWYAASIEDRRKSNKLYKENTIDTRPDDRADADWIAVVENLGEKANGSCAKIKVVEIPDDVQWEIDEYDGIETVREVSRNWG